MRTGYSDREGGNENVSLTHCLEIGASLFTVVLIKTAVQ